MSEGFQEPYTVYRPSRRGLTDGDQAPDPLLTTSRVSLDTRGAQPLLSQAQLAEQQAAQPLNQQQRERALEDLRKAIMDNIGGENNG